MNSQFAPEPRHERDNGLAAQRYVRLRTVDVRECDTLLAAMKDAEIACYTAIPHEHATSTREVFVDAAKTDRAAAVADAAHQRYAGRRVAIDADEVDARFAELIGTFDGPSDVPDPPETTPDPPARGPADEPPEVWRSSDGDWLAEPPEDEDDHFVPPPPQPLPKPTRKVVVGILLMVAGCVSLFAPATMPISSAAALVVGVLLLGAGVAYLVMQLRDRPEDPFDDGSRV